MSATPHAPLGAAASLDFSLPGEPAVISISGEPPQPRDFFVGCRHGPAEPWSLLPFFAAGQGKPAALPKGRYGRFLGWAGDKWMIGPLVFKLGTPFAPQPSANEARLLETPVLSGYLEYDNTHSDDAVELVLGFGGEIASLALDDGPGFALSEATGLAVARGEGLERRRGAAIFGTDSGPAEAFVVAVAPRTKRVVPFVIGFHRAGFHHATLFADLAAVLNAGLAEHAQLLAIAEARDAEFMRCALALPARAEAAHAVRAWLAQTSRRAGEPPVDLAGLRALAAAVRP
jgi:hypothetical protein